MTATDGTGGGRPAPLASVVIATYNGARYLREAIDSVLTQTLPDVEAIVVDDGSTDDTAAILRSYGTRVVVVQQPNAGPCVARNRGLAATRGRFVAFLDHDDRFLPEKLARQVERFDARPTLGVVYTGWHFIDGDGRRLEPTGWPRLDGPVFGMLLLDNPAHLGAPLVRRDLLLAIGGFDERRTGVEDWDLWLRLARTGTDWACVDAPLLEYRVHPGQRHSRGIERVRSNRLAILDEVFADPTLAPELRELAPRAYQNAHLAAAAAYFRSEQPAEGERAFRAAAAARPDLLTDERALRGFCRLLEPIASRRQNAVVLHWRSALKTLHAAVSAALGDPAADATLPRSWRARLALLRVAGHLVSKRLVSRPARALDRA